MRTIGLAKKNSQGMVLVLSLAFLLITSVAGLYMFRASTLDMRMAGNAAAKMASFEDAESARVEAEGDIMNIADDLSTSGGLFNCNQLGAGFFAAPGVGSGCQALDYKQLNWTAQDSIASARASARYALEYLGQDEVFEVNNDVELGADGASTISVYIFRVVGRALSDDGASTLVESLYMVRRS